MFGPKLFVLSFLLLFLSVVRESENSGGMAGKPGSIWGDSRGISCEYRGNNRGRIRQGEDDATKQCCGKGECKLNKEIGGAAEVGPQYRPLCIVNSTERADAVKTCCSSKGKNKGDYAGGSQPLLDRKQKQIMTNPC